MNKSFKTNLGFLILGALLSFLFCELHILKQRTKIDNQSEIIDAYDQYWHSIEDYNLLQVEDRFDYYDSIVTNYIIARGKLIEITNRYESNPKSHS